jgi:hypothetical protein
VARSVVAAFAASSMGELVIASTAQAQLDGFRVGDGEHVVRLRLEEVTFVFEYLVAAGRSDTLLAIGHYPYEGRDSLVTLKVGEHLVDPAAADREIAKPQGISEYAYGVAAGPCGAEAVVIHRDPSDEELPDDDDELPEDVSDVHGLLGFHVRRLTDGHLLAKTPSETPLETGASIFATDRAIVVGQPERVEIIERSGRNNPAILAAPVYAFDPSANRIAIAKPDEGITLFELAR